MTDTEKLIAWRKIFNSSESAKTFRESALIRFGLENAIIKKLAKFQEEHELGSLPSESRRIVCSI